MTLNSLISVRWKKAMQISFSSSQELSVCLLTARDGYKDLKARFDMDPTEELTDLDVNNPLNQSEANPWNQKFKDNELKTIIHQDVIRTFPSLPIFRDLKIQQVLGKILFLWCKLNPDVGYRQGMHELAAVIYYVVIGDAKSRSDPLFDSVVDEDFVEYDAGILFLSLMRSVKPWYEVKAEYVDQETMTPIIATCKRIQGDIIQVLDRELFTHLDFLSIEPQLYGLRWLRLLFSREFEIDEIIELWDGIFENNSNLNLVEWICVAMLLAIKKSLIESDYSGSLTLLMHYPRLSEIGMTIQDLIQNAKKFKSLYESKTFTISTTPTIMDNLDKQSPLTSSNKVKSSKLLALGNKFKPDELETLKKEMKDLKKSKIELERQLSCLKSRDGKFIQTISAVTEDLESLKKIEDLDSIKEMIDPQCDILRLLVESLKHPATEFNQSIDNFRDIGQVKPPKQEIINVENESTNIMDKATTAFMTGVEGLNKVIFGQSEISISQSSVFKMIPKKSLDSFLFTESSELIAKELEDLESDPLGVNNL